MKKQSTTKMEIDMEIARIEEATSFRVRVAVHTTINLNRGYGEWTAWIDNNEQQESVCVG